MSRNQDRSLSVFHLLGLFALLMLFAPVAYADWCSDNDCDNSCDDCKKRDGSYTCCLGCACEDEDDDGDYWIVFTSDDATRQFLTRDELPSWACPAPASTDELVLESASGLTDAASIEQVEAFNSSSSATIKTELPTVPEMP